jgi:hypothetical protein
MGSKDAHQMTPTILEVTQHRFSDDLRIVRAGVAQHATVA